ncbi:MAG: UbiD family decarboxylase [Planctomycetaceae bacterium]
MFTIATGAVWPCTVVGRPPQEDTSFGDIIHEITGPAIPSVIKGVHAVNAVDAAGVHPLSWRWVASGMFPMQRSEDHRSCLPARMQFQGRGSYRLPSTC